MALKKFSELAAAVRSKQDASLRRGTSTSLEQKVESLRETRRKRRKNKRVRRAVVEATLLAAAVAFAFLLAPRRSDFEVGTDRTPGATGVWLSSPPNEEIPLYFPDGSQMVVRSAHFQVEHVEPEGAKIVVDEGSVEASVVHRSGSDWLVAVGPFEIVVRGTRFNASWDPDKRTFRLRMRKGVVTVHGGCLEVPKSAANQESFEVTCPVSEPEANVRESELPDAASSVEPEPEPEPPAASATASSMRSQVGLKDWRTLIREHDPRGALDMIEAAGTFDQTCQTASLSDLTALADTARHAGRLHRANQAYTTIRTRYAGSDAAANSAFYLARLAWQAGLRQQARMWFSTYLAERSSGPLAQEALGRILEIDRNDPTQAKETARRYLARFPGGPHASLANSVLAPPMSVDGGSTP